MSTIGVDGTATISSIVEKELKDVHLALEQADPERFSVLARLAGEWVQLAEQGLGHEDVTVVTRALEA